MTLDDLPHSYRTILCDVWGVIHDGGSLFPGVARRFERWAEEGRKVVILTNAPRPADRVERELEAMGLSRDLWHGLTSSGQAGIEALTHPPRKVGFAGTRDDYDDLVAHGVDIAARGEAIEEIALTGLDEYRYEVTEYEEELQAWLEQDLLVHCLNPDRIVVHQGQRLVCAGALADEFKARGGRVQFYGKPHLPIFRHALALAGDPPHDEVVMVGDGPMTDMYGAKRVGIDGVLVRGGIQEGAEYEWGAEFENWRPIMSVEGL
ncbi:TIGR01459 family HAD-type hydrolase [Sphingomicrobium sediminis]|uniref:TIGR01459 family HAD-type hydrolase n=1 Tax=Sphingomicrobium sediminis TaxID=2950949 RepID=A0A9X2EKB9_9SPHN|nr:TIGR01459 family HAD-type hydrolase [Sphingomicrobium sediminis]MCM8556937.1 TIGR01459 family HAD-type hydrolase [Sphingomicrobium sediminis]